MKIGILLIAILALQKRVDADAGKRCYAQAMCEFPSKNETKLSHVQVYPYPTCGKETLITVVNESYTESIMDFMKKLRKQLVEKKCLSNLSADTGHQNTINKAAKKDKCYSPVICNQKEKAEPRWTQIQPFPHCDESSLQDLRQLFDVSKNEIIKEIENIPVDSPCCQLKVNAIIKGLENESWTLSEEDAEDCFMPVYCHYATGVSDNWMRFYPEKCKSLVSVQQAVNAFDSVLNDVQKDFASEIKEECDVSTTSKMTRTETTSAQTTTKEVTFANTKPPAPEKVANLMVQVNGTSFTPSWSSSTGVTSHDIEIKIGSISILNVTNAENGKEISNSDIKPATMYNLSVVALIDDLRSDAATTPSNTTFNAPKVTIDEVLQNTFQLSWSEVNGKSSYEYKCTPRDSNYTSTSNKSVEIRNLTANTEYTCSVRGTRGSIKGDPGYAMQTTCPTYDKSASGCDAAYNGTCFRFVESDKENVTIANAPEMCENGFELGKITDDCMFNALKKYHEDEKFGESRGKHYWTGTTITQKNVDDYHMMTGYIYNNWRSDTRLDPKVGQYITIKAQNFFGTIFEILGASSMNTDGDENYLHGVFCVKV